MIIHYFEDFCYIDSDKMYKLNNLHTFIIKSILQDKESGFIIYELQKKLKKNYLDTKKIYNLMCKYLSTILDMENLFELKNRNFVLSGKVNARYPVIIQINLTNRCILNCKHCYLSASSTGIDLDFNILCEFLDRLVGKVPIISLSGGEPFLYSKIYKIIDKYHDKFLININSSLSTNNINVDNLKLINFIQTTIYGYDENSFSKFTNKFGFFKFFEKNVKNLRKCDVGIISSYQLSNYNVSEFEKIILKCIDLDIPILTISEIFNKGRAKDIYGNIKNIYVDFYDIIENFKFKYRNYINIEYDLSHKIYEDSDNGFFKCGAGKVIMTVLEDSSVVPCSIFNQEVFKIGKISDNYIYDYFESKFDYLNYNKCILKNKNSIDTKICEGFKI